MVDFRTVQFVKGTALAAGQTDGAVVTALPNRKIRVLSLMVLPTTTPPASVTLNSKGSGAGTAMSPVIPLVAATPMVLSGGSIGLWETNKGEALTITNPVGTTLAVFSLAYVVI